MQLQTDLRQPLGDGVPHLAGLPLAAAVHHCVITVAFDVRFGYSRTIHASNA